MLSTFNYEEESTRVKNALRQEFPHDTIATDPGYKGRVHIKVVSERFNGMSEAQKQENILGLLNDLLDGDTESISLAIAYGTDEL